MGGGGEGGAGGGGSGNIQGPLFWAPILFHGTKTHLDAALLDHSLMDQWVKVFKNRARKICGTQPFKDLK